MEILKEKAFLQLKSAWQRPNSFNLSCVCLSVCLSVVLSAWSKNHQMKKKIRRIAIKWLIRLDLWNGILVKPFPFLFFPDALFAFFDGLPWSKRVIKQWSSRWKAEKKKFCPLSTPIIWPKGEKRIWEEANVQCRQCFFEWPDLI